MLLEYIIQPVNFENLGVPIAGFNRKFGPYQVWFGPIVDPKDQRRREAVEHVLIRHLNSYLFKVEYNKTVEGALNKGTIPKSIGDEFGKHEIEPPFVITNLKSGQWSIQRGRRKFIVDKSKCGKHLIISKRPGYQLTNKQSYLPLIIGGEIKITNIDGPSGLNGQTISLKKVGYRYELEHELFDPTFSILTPLSESRDCPLVEQHLIIRGHW